MDKKLRDEFIKEFNEMVRRFKSGEESEEGLFELTAIFKEKTGGRLSNYNNPLPVGVSAVVVRNKEGEIGILGSRRAIAPSIGEIALPGGYVNELEDTKNAAIRELYEESGLIVEGEENFKLLKEEISKSNVLASYYLYTKEIIDFEEIKKGFEKMNDRSETLEVMFITKETEICFPMHKEIVDNVFEMIERGEIR